MTTPTERSQMRRGFVLIYLYFSIGYLLINWFSEGRSFYYQVALPFEAHIPFVPASVLGYLLVYILPVVMYLMVNSVQLYRRTMISCLILTTISYVVFLLFPVKMVARPAIEMFNQSGFITSLVQVLYQYDRPYNMLPSLHVAYPTLAVMLLWRTRPVGRWVVLAMFVIIACSVLLLKQHYAMDVAAGICAAVLCYFATVKTENVWNVWFERALNFP